MVGWQNSRTSLLAVSLLCSCAVFAVARPADAEEAAGTVTITSEPGQESQIEFVPQDVTGSDQRAETMSHVEFLEWTSEVCGATGCPAAGMFPEAATAAGGDVGETGPMITDRPVRLPASDPSATAAAAHPESESLEMAGFTHAAAAIPEEAYEELAEPQRLAVDMAHAAVYQHDPYPSAKKCAGCHPSHFREWSVSPHAYAQLSPVFNAMSSKLIKLTNGTLGDFCIRCHTPVGMSLCEPIVMSNMDRHPAAREGVTCCVCHRINQAWGKGAGRVALVAADLDGPIYGTLGSEILADVLDNPEKYGVLKTDAASPERGRTVHSPAVPFFQLHTSGFCGVCHDVFAPNGFRLEDAFSEYKASPAARCKQQSCQDCHMGEVPGVPAGYRIEPIAKLGNATTRPRKRTNHMIAGPDYSVIHPGLFPHNRQAIKEQHDAYTHAAAQPEGLATMREWLQFKADSDWGTEEFERSDAAKELDESGPEAWRDPARRIVARQILDDQYELLAEYTEARRRVMSNGFSLGEIQSEPSDCDGLRFKVLVCNKTDGHGVPTGFDAERVIFLRTIVWDSNGKIVFVSGDLDPNGDIRDSHSLYVHNGELPLDPQLFSLQTRFLTRNIRGGEREQVLAVAYSIDPLPYIRPEVRPFTVLGRPVGARKHKQNLAADDGFRWAHYNVDQCRLTGCGPYYVSVQLIEGMVPINLVHDIEDVGFDYNMSARKIAEQIVKGHIVIHQRQAVIHK